MSFLDILAAERDPSCFSAFLFNRLIMARSLMNKKKSISIRGKVRFNTQHFFCLIHVPAMRSYPNLVGPDAELVSDHWELIKLDGTAWTRGVGVGVVELIEPGTWALWPELLLAPLILQFCCRLQVFR